MIQTVILLLGCGILLVALVYFVLAFSLSYSSPTGSVPVLAHALGVSLLVALSIQALTFAGVEWMRLPCLTFVSGFLAVMFLTGVLLMVAHRLGD